MHLHWLPSREDVRRESKPKLSVVRKKSEEHNEDEETCISGISGGFCNPDNAHLIPFLVSSNSCSSFSLKSLDFVMVKSFSKALTKCITLRAPRFSTLLTFPCPFQQSSPPSFHTHFKIHLIPIKIIFIFPVNLKKITIFLHRPFISLCKICILIHGIDFTLLLIYSNITFLLTSRNQLHCLF